MWPRLKNTFFRGRISIIRINCISNRDDNPTYSVSGKERKYVVVAERNRLARDLHDSVKQLLFSIMLTAKGTLNMTQDRDLQEMLSYIGELSQEALQEMTLLIWQLRPEGLEKGLAEAIKITESC